MGWPVAAAIIGSSLLSSNSASNAAQGAQGISQQQYQQYLDLIEKINTPEFKYTEDQLRLQGDTIDFNEAILAEILCSGKAALDRGF